MSKAQVQRLGRRFGGFMGLWITGVAALFVVATVIRLATAS